MKIKSKYIVMHSILAISCSQNIDLHKGRSDNGSIGSSGSINQSDFDLNDTFNLGERVKTDFPEFLNYVPEKNKVYPFVSSDNYQSTEVLNKQEKSEVPNIRDFEFSGLPKEQVDNLCYLRSALQLLLKLPFDNDIKVESKILSIFKDIRTIKENLESLDISDENYQDLLKIIKTELYETMQELAEECFGNEYELQQDAGELISVLLSGGDKSFKNCNFETKKISIDSNIKYEEDQVQSKMLTLNFDPSYEGTVQNLITNYLQEVKVTENGIKVCESIISIEEYMLVSFNKTIQDSKSDCEINYIEPILLNVGVGDFRLVPQRIIVHKGDSLKCGHYIAVDVSDSESITIYDDEKLENLSMENNFERYLELSEEYRKNVTQCLYKVYPIENENE